MKRDLRIYAESFGAHLYHYQDYNNKKIDAVIELPDGQWCAFEIKLGAHQIDAAADNLNKIRSQIDQDPKGKAPSVMLCALRNEQCGLSAPGWCVCSTDYRIEELNRHMY